jgi:hypothetical protein
MSQPLQRLVEINQTMLEVLMYRDADDGVPAASATSSASRSTRSESSTKNGVDLATEDIISFAQASKMIPTQPSVSNDFALVH